MASNILELKLVLNSDQYSQLLKQVQGDTDDTTNKAGQAFNKVAGLSFGFNQILQAAKTVLNTIDSISEPFRQAQSQMAEVASLGVKNIEVLNAGVQSVAQTVGKPLTDLRSGLYQVVSAGVDAANQIDVLESSAMAAQAGLAETTDALNLGSAVIKGYGEDWGEFDSVMDKAFETVKLGQTTFDELAGSAGMVVPLFDAMNVNVNELFGGFAALTGVTGSTAEVSTQLRAIMQGLANPTAELTRLVKEHGYASVEDAAAQDGLAGVMKLVSDATGGSAKQMNKYFSSVEAVTGALALGGSQYDAFISKTNQIANSSGSMAAAFDTMSMSIDAQIAVLQNRWTVVMEKVVAVAVPAANAILGIATAALDTRDPVDKLSSGIDQVNAAMSRSADIDNMIGRYDELSGKVELSADEETELHKITIKLANVFPDAVTAVNEFGEASRINSGYVKLMAEQQKSLFEAQNQNLIKETNKDLTDSLDVLALGNSHLGELNAKYMELKGNYSAARSGIFDSLALKKAENGYKSFKEELGDANDVINKQISLLSNWVDISDEQALDRYAKEVGLTADQYGTLKTRIDSYLESLKAAKQEAAKPAPKTTGGGGTTTTNVVNTVAGPAPALPQMDFSPEIDMPDMPNDVETWQTSYDLFTSSYQGILDFYDSAHAQMKMTDAEYRDSVLSTHESMFNSAVETYGLESSEADQAYQKMLAAKQRFVEADKQLEAQKAAAQKAAWDSILSNTANALTTIFGQNKIAASAAALINTYQGATKALAASPPPLNFVNAGLVTATGLAQVAQINGVSLSKAASGGMIDESGRVIQVGNYGGGENRMIIANSGEYIMDAASTSAYLPVLSAMSSGQLATGGGISGGMAGGGQQITINAQEIGEIVAQKLEDLLQDLQINIRGEMVDYMKFFRDHFPDYDKAEQARSLD